jgi:hypothetical protein
LTNAAVPDKALNNTATVKIGNDPESSVTGPEIYTGGVKFVKQDKQSAAKLAGAEFQLVKLMLMVTKLPTQRKQLMVHTHGHQIMTQRQHIHQMIKDQLN